MFSKFKIEGVYKTFFSSESNFNHYKSVGAVTKNRLVDRIFPALESYIKANGHIDADKLQGDWFPEVDADIFISHSHTNEDLALAIAGLLKCEFNLSAFIDSTVWGNIASLQKAVDRPLRNSEGCYDYDKRNQSTAYVHLLLSTALTKMMDRCEALFFLSTPTSLSSTETNRASAVTPSVWIFHELLTAKYLRRIEPERYNLLQKCFSGGVLEGRVQDGFKFDFKVDLSDFKKLTPGRIRQWIRERRDYDPGTHSLDILYSLYDTSHQNPGRRIIYG